MLQSKTPSAKARKRPLKVGFDFDGVIMYNPARVIRPIVSFFKRKKIFVRRKELEFFIPKKPWQKVLFWLLHQSSLFPAVNIKEIKELVDAGEIEAYIITGRFSFLKPDFQRWLKKINAKNVFKDAFVNERDEQPHLFKARKVEELQLDVFIEDNWNIVQYLHNKFNKKQSEQNLTVFWIYNLFDRNIHFHNRFSGLEEALTHLKQSVLKCEKKRLLVISDYFFPHWTGLSKSLFHLCSAIADSFDIEVLTVKNTSRLKKREFVNNFWIQRTRPILQLSRAFYSPIIIPRAWKKLKNADVMLINSPCTNVLPLAIIGKLMRKKVIIFHQGDLILPEGLLNRLIETVFNIMTILAFSLADTLSTYTKDYGQHSRVMRYYLYKTVPTILPIPSSPSIKKKTLDFKKVKNQITFGFAGRFVEEKGFDILFQAIPDIIEAIPNARFAFAGQTKMQYEQFFEHHLDEINNVKQYVDFLGLLDTTQLTQFYQSVDFFIIPSRSECFGLVQAEAMLQGTPVICSDIPGARQLVKKTKFGMLFESENPADLAETVIKAVKKRKELMMFRQKAKEFLEYAELVEQSKKLFQ